MKGSAKLLASLAVAVFALLAAMPAFATDGPVPNWMPQNVNSGYGNRVDDLYFGIYVIVAAFFFLTEGLILFCCIAFRAREGRKAKYIHGSNVIEVIWTVIPALILIGIGIAQAGTWHDIRLSFPKESDPNTTVIQTFPKQYEWHFRYAGADNQFGSADDVYTTSIHVPLGKKVLNKLSSSDVIHSYFVPHARVKLDAMPGMMGRTWYTMDKYSVWDIKAEKMVILTGEELAGKKVGWSIQNGPTRDHWGFILSETMIDAKEKAIQSGMKKYSYAAIPNKTTVKVWHQGKFQDAPIGEVEFVFHRYEVACAELCGMQHYNMRSFVYVDPPEVYAAWYAAVCAQAAKTGAPETTTKRWHLNWDKAHPTWNKVID
ncbi:MAG: cytochrome c oxidase subunit [Planctomycetota bacterium]|nr:MAG: cytochrome c oxidase subunit [Planctomycetota bacterium]